MIRDMKNYRASNTGTNTKHATVIIAALVAVIALLGWMGERDRVAYVEQIIAARTAHCERM